MMSLKKNFLIGSTQHNLAPSVVNKALMSYLREKGYVANPYVHGLKRRLFSYWHILTARRIVISGIYLSYSELRLIRLLRKKFLYVMHGSYKMETGKFHPKEAAVLKYSNKIASVSAIHAEMIKKEFPEYADKVEVWFNGVYWDEGLAIRKNLDPKDKDPGKIVLFGGGRFMKGNLAVCRAVEQLNEEKNLGLHVDVYGIYSDEDFSKDIKALKCVNFKDLLPVEEINLELAKGNLFIANSKFETFNLSLMDALAVGCNVLFSQFVGAKDLLPAKSDNDIIFDVENIDELKSKIEIVLQNPNNRRLLDQIDFRLSSWENRAKDLAEIVDSL